MILSRDLHIAVTVAIALARKDSAVVPSVPFGCRIADPRMCVRDRSDETGI